MRRLLWRNVVLVLFAVIQKCECKKAEPKSQPRSVNLALETVLEFDQYENSADIKIIDKVQTFLNKVKSIIKKNKVSRRAGGEASEGPLSFSDFAKSVLVILSSYSDDDLEQIASVVDEELRKYHYKGCKFYELVENENLRRFMADKLQDIKARTGKELKKQLKAIIKKLTDENRGFKHKLISRYLDSLYTEEDAKAFNNFLRHMATYRRKTKRSHMDINKIIKDGLRRIVFDHYSNLDVDTRRDLKFKLESFWKDFSDNVAHHVWKMDANPNSKIKIERESSWQEADKGTDTKFVEKEDSKQEKELELETPKPKIKSKHKKKKKHVKDNKIKTTTEKVEDFNQPEIATKPQKMTFITLYPEAITIPRKHHKRKPPQKTHKKHKKIKPTTESDLVNRHVTLLINADPNEQDLPNNDELQNSDESIRKEINPVIKKRKENLRKPKKRKASIPVKKQVISDVKFSIDVKRVKKKDRDARKDVSRMRFYDNSGSIEARPTEPYKKLKTKAFTFKRDLDAGESDDGLAIDVGQNSGDESPIHEGRPIRKSNTNDTLTLKPVIRTTTKKAVPTEDFIKRIKQLETELKDVKKHLVKEKEHKKLKKHLVEEEEEEEQKVEHKTHSRKNREHSLKKKEHTVKNKEHQTKNKERTVNEKDRTAKEEEHSQEIEQVWSSTHKSIEHFDVLDFWERTEAPLTKSSKAMLTRTTTAPTTTSVTTLDTEDPSTETPEPTKKKNHYHKTKTTETTLQITVETITEGTTKPRPPKPIPTVFRSVDREAEETNEVIPKSSTKTTKTRHERADLKSRGTKPLDNAETTKRTPFTTTNQSEEPNITVTEASVTVTVATVTSTKKATVEPEIKQMNREKERVNVMNETKLDEKDEKAKLVKKKMLEDLRDILPDGDDPELDLIQTETTQSQKPVEHNFKTTEQLSVAKLGSTKDAMDDFDDEDPL